MNIALATVYGDVYAKDKIFITESCPIGENLLIPGIELKKHLIENGHEFHTIDMYSSSDIDSVIFQDISTNYRKAISNPFDFIRYVLKKKWKNDYLEYVIENIPINRRILIMQEPPIVCASSYKLKLHKYFGKILTWNDDLVDNRKYFKFFYPQVLPDKQYNQQIYKKRFLTMICGNKQSHKRNELYSERRKVIAYFETKKEDFDLYGFGWEKENLTNYRGETSHKLQTLSKYKFAVCYENMCNINGYITEKIFDCFFANCIPIYWGANNISNFIPDNTYIDRRKFRSMDELVLFLKDMSDREYGIYLKNIQKYLKSRQFYKEFSVESYINRISELLFG